jgi:murein DD-endopeptidase MepM/ murein hydrolase activator NlpD
VAAAVWLAVARWPALAPAGSAGWLPLEAPALPAPLEGFLTALGTLLFLPVWPAGAVVAMVIALRSRILLLAALAGWAAGAAVRAAAVGSWDAAWGAGDGFNAMLAAMAVGAVFLVPSWRSLALGLVAAAACALAGDALAAWSAWGGAGLPAFTLPFALVVLAALHVLGLARSPLLAARPGATPEDTLAEHWAERLRFPGTLRSIAPPFAGTWTVWQAGDGPWTHRGAWRDALDVVVCGGDGRTHAGDGARLEDYHAFRRPVLAPVAGQVVAVVDGVPDNPPGTVDHARPWGNLVVIHDARGFFVELSHLACGSLLVAPGQWVARGQELGRCGSSGRSPQPHLHLQVQASAAVGAPALPFSLASWWDGERFQANALPRLGGGIEAVPADPALEPWVRLNLGDRLVFAARRQGRPAGTVRWQVVLGDDGGLVIASPHGRLHCGRHEDTFYCYRVEGRDPWLRALLLALPRLPLCRRDGLVWEDRLPVSAAGTTPATVAAGLAALARPAWAVLRARHRFEGPWTVRGEVRGAGLRIPTCALCDPARGLVRIAAGTLDLQREADHAAP